MAIMDGLQTPRGMRGDYYSLYREKGHQQECLSISIWIDSRVCFWRRPYTCWVNLKVTALVKLSKFCKWGMCCLPNPKRIKRCLCINILCAKNTQYKDQSISVSRQCQGWSSPWLTNTKAHLCNMYGEINYLLWWFFCMCMSLVNVWNGSSEEDVINITSSLRSWRNVDAIKILPAKTMWRQRCWDIPLVAWEKCVVPLWRWRQIVAEAVEESTEQNISQACRTKYVVVAIGMEGVISVTVVLGPSHCEVLSVFQV